jgi:Sec-independent protein secretion pathway component TatC
VHPIALAQDPALVKYANMYVNRHKFFRWTRRTAGLSFAYAIVFPAFVGYWAYTTDVSSNPVLLRPWAGAERILI